MREGEVERYAGEAEKLRRVIVELRASQPQMVEMIDALCQTHGVVLDPL